MTWYVQYWDGSGDHVDEWPSPEEAIEAACLLLDDGHHVFGIGTSPLADDVGEESIARIYKLWIRPRQPFAAD